MITVALLLAVCFTAILFNANTKSSLVLYYDYDHEQQGKAGSADDDISMAPEFEEDEPPAQRATNATAKPSAPQIHNLTDAPVFEEDEPVIEMVADDKSSLASLRNAARQKDPNKIAQERFEKYASGGK